MHLLHEANFFPVFKLVSDLYHIDQYGLNDVKTSIFEIVFRNTCGCNEPKPIFWGCGFFPSAQDVSQTVLPGDRNDPDWTDNVIGAFAVVGHHGEWWIF